MKAIVEAWRKGDVYARDEKIVETKTGFLYVSPGGREVEYDGETLVIRWGLKPNYNAPLKDTPKLRKLLDTETKEQSKLLKRATLDAMVLSKRHLMEPGKSLGVKPVLEIVLWRAIEPKDARDLTEAFRALMTALKSWSKKREGDFLGAVRSV